MQWVVDIGGDVFVYDNNGVLLGQWTPRNVGKPERIAVWGRDLWSVDPTQDRVFKFAGGADLRTGPINATSSFALNSGNVDATDIVTDGAHLWVTNITSSTDKVFRYTTAGTLEGSWILPADNATPTGITLDPANVNHLWVVDAGTDRIYQSDGATVRLSGTQSASVSFGLAAGNSDPQGIADPLPVAPSCILPAVLEPNSAVLQTGGVSSQIEWLISKPLAPSEKQLPLASKPLPRWELVHEGNLESTKLDFEEVISRPTSVLREFWDAALLDRLTEEDSPRPLKTI